MFSPTRSLSRTARLAYSQAAQNVSGVKPPAGPGSSGASVNPNVPGLSSNVVKAPTTPLGPGASHTGEYKVPEYYAFNRFSFAEAEVEIAKYRLPQPSAGMKK